MKSISIFKKIKLFNFFKSIVKENKKELNVKFNIRIDRAFRLYTVVNIPEEMFGEAFSLKRSDIDKISENYIKQYSNALSDFLNSKGLNELYDFYTIDKVGKYSYLMIFGFSLFKSQKYYNTLYISLTFTILLSFILLLFFLI